MHFYRRLLRSNRIKIYGKSSEFCTMQRLDWIIHARVSPAAAEWVGERASSNPMEILSSLAEWDHRCWDAAINSQQQQQQSHGQKGRKKQSCAKNNHVKSINCKWRITAEKQKDTHRRLFQSMAGAVTLHRTATDRYFIGVRLLWNRRVNIALIACRPKDRTMAQKHERTNERNTRRNKK